MKDELSRACLTFCVQRFDFIVSFDKGVIDEAGFKRGDDDARESGRRY